LHARAVEHDWKVHQWHFSLQFRSFLQRAKAAFGSCQSRARDPGTVADLEPSEDATFSSSDRYLFGHRDEVGPASTGARNVDRVFRHNAIRSNLSQCGRIGDGDHLIFVVRSASGRFLIAGGSILNEPRPQLF
jgi:hypothetical protein